MNPSTTQNSKVWTKTQYFEDHLKIIYTPRTPSEGENLNMSRPLPIPRPWCFYSLRCWLWSPTLFQDLKDGVCPSWTADRNVLVEHLQGHSSPCLGYENENKLSSHRKSGGVCTHCVCCCTLWGERVKWLDRDILMHICGKLKYLEPYFGWEIWKRSRFTGKLRNSDRGGVGEYTESE